MDWFAQPMVFWLMVVVHGFGFLGLLAARVGQRSSSCTRCQSLFYASFLLVGLATLLSVLAGTGYWIASATLVSIMAVGATLDLRDETGQAVW